MPEPPADERSPTRRAARQVVARLARQVGLATRAEVKEREEATFAQAAALMQLQHVLNGRGPWRPFRSWAISPDAALWLAAAVIARRPRLVVECGAGTSSAVVAATFAVHHLDSRLVTLEHDAGWAEHTRGLQAGYGVEAEVRHAPLRPAPGEPSSVEWYDPDAWSDLADIDLLMVDGPPDRHGEHTRAPVVDHLGPRLADSALVLIDDAHRPGELAMIERWLQVDRRMRRRDLPAEKGLCALSRSAEALAFELP